MITDDKAKAALEARAQLQHTLATIATALQQVAVVLAESAVALESAVAAEAEATSAYVVELERRVSEQRVVS